MISVHIPVTALASAHDPAVTQAVFQWEERMSKSGRPAFRGLVVVKGYKLKAPHSNPAFVRKQLYYRDRQVMMIAQNIAYSRRQQLSRLEF